jgi:hypothetical protein
MAGVTEANLPAGQEKREERIGNTVERFDAARRQIRPALRVALGSALCASKPSTVVPATLFGLFLLSGLPNSMTLRNSLRSPGYTCDLHDAALDRAALSAEGPRLSRC